MSLLSITAWEVRSFRKSATKWAAHFRRSLGLAREGELIESGARQIGRRLMNHNATITANGRPVPASLPCTIEEFLVAQQLLPRSVVVEHNGEAVAPSEFPQREVRDGDRLEIVRIVAGG